MLDDILALPGNRPVFEALTRLLAEQQAIAFVGAGASAGMYPLWGQFIDQLADYAVAQGKAEPQDRDRWRADKTSTPQQAETQSHSLQAIELLLDAGALAAADALYEDRLANGRMLRSLPALPEGLRCALGFVHDEARRKQCAAALSQGHLAFYLNDVGLFASLSGH